MPPGLGIRRPSRRTRTGCLTCRKRKVKCDEEKPSCARCVRLSSECVWQDFDGSRSSPETSTKALVHVTSPPLLSVQRMDGTDSIISVFSPADAMAVPYLKHFVTFCTKFLAYPNDSGGNPFERYLVPLASQSPALFHSMSALAAGHMARRQPKHTIAAMRHYTKALGALNDTINNSDLHSVKSDAVLGSCLLLCVYEISHSDESLWYHHLQGARDLIMHRGGPSTNDFLVRWFSFLDISGSLLTNQGPLIPGNYWLESAHGANSTTPRNWPYYDDGVMVDNFHALMVYMARLSNLSNFSMTDEGKNNPDEVHERAEQIHQELTEWWDSRPSEIRHQSNAWRTIPRIRELTDAEKLEEESFSSTRSVLCGCMIYLYHIVDPLGEHPQEQEVADAIMDILEIARETPEGRGLEMGLFFGLFMAGVALFDDVESEALIRKKMSDQRNISIYHADNALVLLEALWMKQRHDDRKYDWRELQEELKLQVFILA